MDFASTLSRVALLIGAGGLMGGLVGLNAQERVAREAALERQETAAIDAPRSETPVAIHAPPAGSVAPPFWWLQQPAPMVLERNPEPAVEAPPARRVQPNVRYPVPEPIFSGERHHDRRR